MATIKVSCPRDGAVLTKAPSLVIDDEDMRYRFRCPKCGKGIDKPLDDNIRGLLRSVGVPTIDELCESFAGMLNDDRAVARWLLSVE